MTNITIKTAGGGLGMPTANTAVGTEFVHAVQLQTGNYTDVALEVNGMGSGIQFTGQGTSNTRSFNAKLADVVSVMDYGATGNGSTDDTAAIQAAITFCIGSQTAGTDTPYMLYFPAGTYKITAALNITTGNTATLTGFCMSGAGKYATTIIQYTNNTPIFSMAPSAMHSCLFENMQLTYNTMQTSNTSGNVFNITGTIADDVYNCKWYNIRSNNFYYFMNCPTVLWWGNCYEFCWFGDMYQGVNNIQGATGEPRNTFINLYIGCASCVGVLFNHFACYCSFYNIEINGANSGATMIADSAGGGYIIGHWAIEVATYASGNPILFNIPNGYLKAEYIYTNTLTISTGVTLTAFGVNNNVISRVDVGYLTVTFASNSGNYYIISTPGPSISHFHYLDNVPFSSTCSLTNIVGSTSAASVVVDDWNDYSRVQMNGTSNVTLAYNSAVNQVFDVALTGATTITMPDDTQVATCNLFNGRRFRIIKTNTSAQTLTILNHAGSTIATISSGNRAVIEIMWNCTGGSAQYTWKIVDQHVMGAT